MWPRAGLVALAGVLGLTTACKSELPELTYEGEFVRVGTDFDAPICAGNLADFDREIARIETTFDLGSEGKTELRILDDLDSFARHCPPDVGGCRAYVPVPGAFAKRTAPQAPWHEFVHDRTARARLADLNRSKALFVEGLAESLEWARCEPEIAFELPSAESMLETSGHDYSQVQRMVAGQFTRWLLDTHGAAQVQALMLEVGAHDSPNTVRKAYFDRFGSDIDTDLFAHIEWGSAGRHPYELGCRGETPPSDPTARAFELRADLDCSAANVRSKFWRDDGQGFIEWTLEVGGGNSPGGTERYDLVGEVPEGTELTIALCDCYGFVEPDPIVGYFFEPKVAQPLDHEYLAPGLYRIVWSGPLDAGLHLDVTLERPCDDAAQNCPEGQQCRGGECEPEVQDPAESGDPCVQVADEPWVCAGGAECLGVTSGDTVTGWCTTMCGWADQYCGEGEGCSIWGFCGPSCDLSLQDCADGYACLSSDSVCVPSGGVGLLEPCWTNDCAPGLACEPLFDVPGCINGIGAGCCVPLCASGQDCPPELPNCGLDYLTASVSVCLP